MPTANSQVNFAHYSRAAFNALGAKNDNTFYVVLEVDGDRTLYLGNVQIDGLKWNAYVPTGRTIAGLDLTANRTRDALLGVSANGFYRRTGANTYDVRTSANVKSDIGLGSVQNYPIATKAQAEAGSANAQYMTPLRTAEAIAALAPSGGGGAINVNSYFILGIQSVSIANLLINAISSSIIGKAGVYTIIVGANNTFIGVSDYTYIGIYNNNDAVRWVSWSGFIINVIVGADGLGTATFTPNVEIEDEGDRVPVSVPINLNDINSGGKFIINDTEGISEFNVYIKGVYF